MTGTSLKSPMSGTLTSIVLIGCAPGVLSLGSCGLHRPRRRLRRIEPVFFHRLGGLRRGQRAVIGQRLERSYGDVEAIDLEEAAQLFARVRPAVAVGAEHAVATWHVGADLLGE